MARAIKGFHLASYMALSTPGGSDVEMMSPTARKAYYQRHLRMVEAQIYLLASKLGVDVTRSGRDWAWSSEPLDDEQWTSLVSLDYLFAARDALKRTLATL
ncbi:MAG: hypothetical protein ACYC4R_02475 [Anaerolineae bacterium]